MDKEKEIEKYLSFDEEAIKILDDESNKVNPNVSRCILAVGYTILALGRYLEEDINETLQDKFQDISEAIDSLLNG